MALPGEKEHKEYMDYVIEMQSNGQEPLPKDEWRKTMKNSKAKGDGVVSALKQY